MTTKIDGAGRLVVPKPLRERLGLRAGTDVEIQEGPEGILIRRAEREPLLVQEGQLLVHTGKLPAGYDISKAIDEEREARLRGIWSR